MAQVIVRNLEGDVKARLKRRAGHHGRSTEEEVPATFCATRSKLGSRIAALFAKAGLSTDLPELHVQVPRSAEFAK